MAEIPGNAYVMIIGAMKCGTSSLYKYLVCHPAISPCIVKEPEFFSENQGHRYNGASRYEELWKFDQQVHRYALEASTGYTKYPQERNVPRKIYEYGLKPKFIYLVRNPFDRILSQYQYHIAQAGFDRSTPLTWEHFVSLSNYFMQLSRYRPYFSREQFLILDFDELSNRPQACVERVCDFLQIPAPSAPSHYAVHNRTVHRTDAVVARSPVLQKAAELLPGPVRRLGKRVLAQVLKERTFSERERESILSLLRDDMRRLQTEYGVDVSKWGWT